MFLRLQKLLNQVQFCHTEMKMPVLSQHINIHGNYLPKHLNLSFTADLAFTLTQNTICHCRVTWSQNYCSLHASIRLKILEGVSIGERVTRQGHTIYRLEFSFSRVFVRDSISMLCEVGEYVVWSVEVCGCGFVMNVALGVFLPVYVCVCETAEMNW